MINNRTVKSRVVIALFLSCNISQFAAIAQNQPAKYETWWGVMTSTRVLDQFSLWNDLHFVNDLFFLYRTGITYHSKNEQFNTTVGYGLLKLSTPFSQGELIRNEHRPWMQTVYRPKAFGAWNINFRYRYDARFIQATSQTELLQTYRLSHRHRFSNALRYNTQWKPNGNNTFISLLNEALFNWGSGIRFEHRTHLLANINISNTTFSLGYVVRYFELNPTSSRINHGPVFWMSHQINFLKKKKTERVEYPEENNY